MLELDRQGDNILKEGRLKNKKNEKFGVGILPKYNLSNYKSFDIHCDSCSARVQSFQNYEFLLGGNKIMKCLSQKIIINSSEIRILLKFIAKI